MLAKAFRELELCDVNAILDMDWLSTYKAQINYFAKPMIL